jgi:hypothetical protein
VHIAIKQIRPRLRSAVCRSTQFAMYINNKQLSIVSQLQSALLKVNCAEQYTESAKTKCIHPLTKENSMLYNRLL